MAKKKVLENGEQQHIPTLEPERDEELYPLAVAYRREMQKRVRANKTEKTAKEVLIAKMMEKGVSAYEDPDGWIVTVDVKRNVHISDAEESSNEE